MRQALLFAIPAITFLLVGGVAVILVMYWSKRFGGRSKALTARLKDVSELRFSDFNDILAKSQATASTDVISRLLARVPGRNRINILLIRSGSDRTANEILALSIGLGGVLYMLSLALSAIGPLIGIPLALIGACIPFLYLLKKENERLTKFESQLPEALDFLSRALRAGHGLTAALAMVGDELKEPISKEFKTTFDEINFGLSFNQAISNLALRVNSPDLNFFVVALLIQRETGGNLAELLENLSKTVRERMKLMGKVKVISAEGRLSGVVISLMPFVMAGLMTLVNAEYMSPLWQTPTGNKMVLIGLSMMGFGVFWISRVVKVKV